MFYVPRTRHDRGRMARTYQSGDARATCTAEHLKLTGKRVAD
jgi:hypothetical protein